MNLKEQQLDAEAKKLADAMVRGAMAEYGDSVNLVVAMAAAFHILDWASQQLVKKGESPVQVSISLIECTAEIGGGLMKLRPEIRTEPAHVAH